MKAINDVIDTYIKDRNRLIKIKKEQMDRHDLCQKAYILNLIIFGTIALISKNGIFILSVYISSGLCSLIGGKLLNVNNGLRIEEKCVYRINLIDVLTVLAIISAFIFLFGVNWNFLGWQHILELIATTLINIGLMYAQSQIDANLKYQVKLELYQGIEDLHEYGEWLATDDWDIKRVDIEKPIYAVDLNKLTTEEDKKADEEEPKHRCILRLAGLEMEISEEKYEDIKENGIKGKYAPSKDACRANKKVLVIKKSDVEENRIWG